MNPYDFKRWRQTRILSPLLAGCGGAENDVETLPQSRANPEKHCVGKAQAVKPGEQLSGLSAETQETCFPTFSEAISFATRGAVQPQPLRLPGFRTLTGVVAPHAVNPHSWSTPCVELLPARRGSLRRSLAFSPVSDEGSPLG